MSSSGSLVVFVSELVWGSRRLKFLAWIQTKRYAQCVSVRQINLLLYEKLAICYADRLKKYCEVIRTPMIPPSSQTTSRGRHSPVGQSPRVLRWNHPDSVGTQGPGGKHQLNLRTMIKYCSSHFYSHDFYQEETSFESSNEFKSTFISRTDITSMFELHLNLGLDIWYGTRNYLVKAEWQINA